MLAHIVVSANGYLISHLSLTLRGNLCCKFMISSDYAVNDEFTIRTIMLITLFKFYSWLQTSIVKRDFNVTIYCTNISICDNLLFF